MNANVQAWVDALLSGEYKQGSGTLRGQIQNGGPDEFCCLGVACELAVKAGLIPPAQKFGGIPGVAVCFKYGDPANEPTSWNYLPRSVQRWLGLTTSTGEFEGNSFPSLTMKNDSGMKFADIAAIIKSEPKGLFNDEIPTQG